MPFGSTRGVLSDRVTQRWVQITGRRINVEEFAWLSEPIGTPDGVGSAYFENLAKEKNLVLSHESGSGLLENFRSLQGPSFDPDCCDPGIPEFYEHTAEFRLDAWSQWCGAFRPLGGLLATIFSRRLQQLNVPLSPLDTSRGLKSEILRLSTVSGQVKHIAWLRHLAGSGHVLYAGIYSMCRVPGFSGPCVRVTFPLPNGNAVVIMKPANESGGALSLESTGVRFGDPGFYFTVHADDGRVWARYVRSMQETITVYPGANEVRADHVLRLWGVVFLKLHYRMQKMHEADSGTIRGLSRVSDIKASKH